MAKNFLVPINLHKNQLIQARIENVAVLPDPADSVAGQVVTLTSVTPNVVYFFDGTAWEPTRTTGPAGGDLEGNFPAPTLREDVVDTREIAPRAVTTTEIAEDTIVHGNVNPANIDGVPATPSLRTLGTGPNQATAGDDPRLTDTRTPTDATIYDVHVNDDAAIQRNKIADPVNDVSNGGYRLTQLAPGTTDTDAATVAQVNAARQGLDAKDSVRVATTDPLAATATADTLTATGNGILSIDGVAVAGGDRVLIKDQTDETQNGIYTVTATGNGGAPWVLTRTVDAIDPGELSTGSQTLVEAGTANGQQAWAVITTTADVWTAGAVGTHWTQIAGISEVTAGDGLVREAGNVIHVQPGLGIIADADETRIDTAVVARLVEGPLPAGGTSTTITHNLGRRGVLVQLYSTAAPYDQVEADILRTSANVVTVVTSEPLPANLAYVIHG